MKLSIIIPVYNEEKTIAEVLRKVVGTRLPGNIRKEIVVVDDGSTDNSKFEIQKTKLKLKIKSLKLICHRKNRGKGRAIKTALKYATGDYVLIQDADLEYDPGDYPRLLPPILKGKAEVVYGSRFTGEHRNLFFWHWLSNRFLNLVIDLLYNTTLSDMEVGYKVFKTEILQKINWKAARFDFEPEVTVKILKKGIRIYEVPISYAGRDYSEGKKISGLDGLIALWTIIKYRFGD